MANPVADSSIMGTMSNYASSAWNTFSTTMTQFGGKVYECGKCVLNKGYELVQKVIEFVKPFFNNMVNFVKNNPGPVAATLALGAAMYYAASNYAGSFFGATATTTATATATA